MAVVRTPALRLLPHTPLRGRDMARASPRIRKPASPALEAMVANSLHTVARSRRTLVTARRIRHTVDNKLVRATVKHRGMGRRRIQDNRASISRSQVSNINTSRPMDRTSTRPLLLADPQASTASPKAGPAHTRARPAKGMAPVNTRNNLGRASSTASTVDSRNKASHIRRPRVKAPVGPSSPIRGARTRGNSRMGSRGV